MAILKVKGITYVTITPDHCQVGNNEESAIGEEMETIDIPDVVDYNWEEIYSYM